MVMPVPAVATLSPVRVALLLRVKYVALKGAAAALVVPMAVSNAAKTASTSSLSAEILVKLSARVPIFLLPSFPCSVLLNSDSE